MTDNATKLAAFVAGHKLIAAGKPPAEAAQHLYAWAGYLNEQMALLGLPDTPARLLGLDAFAIANARDELAAAAAEYEDETI